MSVREEAEERDVPEEVFEVEAVVGYKKGKNKGNKKGVAHYQLTWKVHTI
jgi:hypothetical protein